MKLALSISGRIFSKKNSRRFIFRGGRRFLVPSAAYTKFASDAVDQIWTQTGTLVKPMFTGFVKVSTDIYMVGRTRVDADNLHTGLLDILQRAKVIDDDANVLKGEYSKTLEAAEWHAQITIESI